MDKAILALATRADQTQQMRKQVDEAIAAANNPRMVFSQWIGSELKDLPEPLWIQFEKRCFALVMELREAAFHANVSVIVVIMLHICSFTWSWFSIGKGLPSSNHPLSIIWYLYRCRHQGHQARHFNHHQGYYTRHFPSPRLATRSRPRSQFVASRLYTENSNTIKVSTRCILRQPYQLLQCMHPACFPLQCLRRQGWQPSKTWPCVTRVRTCS